MCLSLCSTSNTVSDSWLNVFRLLEIILSKSNMEERKWDREERAASKEFIITKHLKPTMLGYSKNQSWICAFELSSQRWGSWSSVTSRRSLPVGMYSPGFYFQSSLQPPERALGQLKIGQDAIKYTNQDMARHHGSLFIFS